MDPQQASPAQIPQFTRAQAYQIVTKFLTNKNLIKHSLAAEVAMRSLYYRMNPNPLRNPDKEEQGRGEEEKWGITGLLHDADYEMAKGHPEKHGLLLFEKVPTGFIPDDIVHAIKAHNYEKTGVTPQTPMDWAIACCDQLTGLIVACALVHPDKKLAPLTTEFVMKRMNEKSFARGADRTVIKLCEQKLNISLEEFTTVVLNAMKTISPQLGL